MIFVPDGGDNDSYSPWDISEGDILDSPQLRRDAERFALGDVQVVHTNQEVGVVLTLFCFRN